MNTLKFTAALLHSGFLSNLADDWINILEFMKFYKGINAVPSWYEWMLFYIYVTYIISILLVFVGE